MKTNSHIGIDFGTTKTLISQWMGDHPEVLQLGEEGRNDIPTVLHTENGSQFTFGATAEAAALFHRAGFIREFKRLLGTEHGRTLNGRTHTPAELTAVFLKEVIAKCQEEATQTTIDRAVITVPVSFGPAARDALKNAALSSGLKDVHFVDEPVAAAMAYLHEQKRRNGPGLAHRLIVFDWGGGTLDLALAEIEGEKISIHPELRSGNPRLGGVDIDERLHEWVSGQLKAKGRRALDEMDGEFSSRNTRAIITAKISLSKRDSIQIALQDQDGPVALTLTREQFNCLVFDLCQEAAKLTTTLVQRACDKGYAPNQILMIGGSSRILLIQELLKSSTQLPLVPYHNSLSAVSLGAAIQASIKFKTSLSHFQDVKGLRNQVHVFWKDSKFYESFNLAIDALDQHPCPGYFELLLETIIALPYPASYKQIIKILETKSKARDDHFSAALYFLYDSFEIEPVDSSGTRLKLEEFSGYLRFALSFILNEDKGADDRSSYLSENLNNHIVLESGSFFLSLAQLTIKQKTGNLDPSDLKEVQKVCQGNLIGMGRVMLICINGIKGDGGRGLQYLEIYKDSLSVVENFSPHCLDAIAGQAVALYFEGNCERSAPLFEKIIDTPGSILSGNALLGYIYLCGLSYYGIGNAEAAKKRFKQVHELEPNNTEVINYLGNISNFENDPKAAISYFKEAADKGDPDGEFNYANMIYARSCITERNEAIAYLRRAVAKGHADAHFKLAEILSNGKTPLGNETIQLVCKSAELGSIEGAFLAGLFYINGVGVTVDMARGATLLLKAAENGHAHAADALGFLHKRSGNNNSSIEFFNRARELGHPNPGQEDPFQSEIPWGTIAAGVGAGLLALFGLS